MDNKINNINHTGNGDIVMGDKYLNTPPAIGQQLSSVPKRNKENLIGRNTDLQAISNHFNQSEHTRLVLLNGMGGIGKTSLAEVFASHFADKYNHILWLNYSGSFKNSIIAVTADLCARLHIQIAQDEKADMIYHRIIAKLASLTKPCLLVIDNADASLEEEVDDLPNWHILTTSRSTIEGFEPLNVDFLSENDAFALFKHHYKKTGLNEAEIKAIINYLELHTLAIEVFAKIADSRRSTFKELQQIFTDNPKLSVKVKGQPIDRVKDYLAALFKTEKLTEAETWLLKQFLVLPAISIPYSQLEILIPQQENPTLPELLNALSSNGWLQYNSESDSYKLHKIVAEAVQIQIPIAYSDVEGLVQNVSEKLSVQSGDNFLDKVQWIGVASSLTDRLQPLEKHAADVEAITVFYNNYGSILKAMGRLDEALPYSKQALDLSTDKLGPDYPYTISYINNYGGILQAMGRLEEALPYLKQALDLRTDKLGQGHPNTITSINNYGGILQAMGRLDEALPYFKQALDLSTDKLGPDHPITISSIQNYGYMLQDMGRLDEALDYKKQALDLRIDKLGPDHPDTITSIQNYGYILQAMGRQDEAITYFKQALDLSTVKLGPDHPDTITSINNYGGILQDMGRLEEALPYLKQALDLSTDKLGPDHPNTITSINNYGSILQDMSRQEEALPYFKQALDLRTAKLGPDHPDTISSINNYGGILQDMGRLEEALPYFKQALDLRTDKLGQGHPNTITSIQNYAFALYNAQRWKAAEPVLLKALNAAKKAKDVKLIQLFSKMRIDARSQYDRQKSHEALLNSLKNIKK